MKNIYRSIVISALLLLLSTSNAFAGTFPDVHESDRFYDEIMYLSGQGIITGHDNGEFRPDDKVTRAQAAIMLGRVLGYKGEPTETSFPDVSKSNRASGFIQEAYENNIISGYTNGEFRPDNYVTRGEMAIFIARAYALTDEELVPFSDVSLNVSAYSSIRKIIAFGVTAGYPDGRFQPGLDLTRAQFSAFLARAESEDFRLSVDTCGYDSSSRVNPDRQTMNCLMTKAAQKFQIPPEIVKAVATQENGEWKHFDENGEPVENTEGDGGYGLMQITNMSGLTEEQVMRLKYDVNYNIEIGIQFLLNNFKRGDLPKINNHDAKLLESWYFPIMAYNGAVPENSPFYQETGERNDTAYQEEVYANLNEPNRLYTNIEQIPMKSGDFRYDRDSDEPIEFLVDRYEMDESLLTGSKEFFKAGDVVRYEGSGIRSIPSTQGSLTNTNSSVSMKVISAPVYDTNPGSVNKFVWYPVEAAINGKSVKGYIASKYIIK